MSAQHTPGPWETDEADHDMPHLDIKIRAKRHGTIATVWIDDAPEHEFNRIQQANARLIAAAPDLLAACEAALALMEADIADDAVLGFGPDDEVVEVVQQLRDAIAKAKGERDAP